MPAVHRAADPAFWQTGPPNLEMFQVAAQAFDGALACFPLGDAADPDAPLITILRLPPGFVLSRHAHPCHRVEVILQGSLTVEGEVLGPGDVAVSPPMEKYGPHVAGPEGCTSVECFSSAAGIVATVDQESMSASERIVSARVVDAIQRWHADNRGAS